jgi:glyoxylase I family protein
MRLHHLAVQVHDVARACAFYEGVLGLRRLREQQHSVWLALGDGMLMLEKAAAAPAPVEWKTDAPGLHLVAFGIARDEREAWRARLAAAGHPVVHETTYTLYVRDPEGNRVGLSHYPDS